MAATPFVAISAGRPSATMTSVDLGQAVFPINDAILSYTITDGINGTYTVGTGGNFTTFTGTNGVFASLANSTLTGDATFKVSSNITEPGTYSLNTLIKEGGNWKVSIIPNDASEKIITGASSASSIFQIVGVANVSIDGSYNGAGRYLKFVGTNTSGSNIFMINGNTSYTKAKNIEFKNINIFGASKPLIMLIPLAVPALEQILF